jgi:hypothetical protein
MSISRSNRFVLLFLLLTHVSFLIDSNHGFE